MNQLIQIKFPKINYIYANKNDNDTPGPTIAKKRLVQIKFLKKTNKNFFVPALLFISILITIPNLSPLKNYQNVHYSIF